MRIAPGPRPWTIWIFVLVSTALLINSLIGDLRDPMVALARYGWLAPSTNWSEESLIVVAATGFTIKMIPIALIGAFAVRIARWLVLAMAIIPLPFSILSLLTLLSVLKSRGVAGEVAVNHLIFFGISHAVHFGIIALLFLPPSNRWFARKGEDQARDFE